MEKFVIVLTALLLIPLTPSCGGAQTQLALSAGNDYMNFRFDIAQRCYSLDSCYAGKGSYASWMALKDSARIAFYTKSECRGDVVTVNSSPRGTLKLAEVGFDKKIWSFVLWEIGTSAMNGYLDICHGRESAVFNATSASGWGMDAGFDDFVDSDAIFGGPGGAGSSSDAAYGPGAEKYAFAASVSGNVSRCEEGNTQWPPAVKKSRRKITRGKSKPLKKWREAHGLLIQIEPITGPLCDGSLATANLGISVLAGRRKVVMAPASRGVKVVPAMEEARDNQEQRPPTDQEKTPMSSPMVSDDSEGKQDESQLSPRSRRRRKNRDQMRVARQNERETMQRLRETVHRLEARYQEALARGILETPTDATSSTAAPNATVEAAEVVSQSLYVSLVEEGARLKDENFRFRRALHEKNKLQETLERLYGDFHQPLTLEEINTRRCVFEDQCMHDSWTPLTEEEVWAYIRATHDRVAATMEAISRRAALRRLDPTIKQLPPFLGWQVRYHREDDEVLFSFEKPFYHVTALQAMQHTWENELTMQSYRKPVDVATQSMTIFQLINDDTYVFRRRMRFREQVITTHYLRFRLKTHSGYALGHCSVNKGPPQQAGEIWAGNLSLWTDFNTAWSELDQEYCVVRISGRMNVNATESAATRAAVDIIFGLLSWENLNIGPVFTFTAS